MPLPLRMLVAVLIAAQAWVGVIGGGSLGCVRLWACLSESTGSTIRDEPSCSCCKAEPIAPAPAETPRRSHDNSGCCVSPPDLFAPEGKDGASLRTALSIGDVVALIGESSPIPARIDHAGHGVWRPPPDPGVRRAAAGLATTRFLI